MCHVVSQSDIIILSALLKSLLVIRGSMFKYLLDEFLCYEILILLFGLITVVSVTCIIVIHYNMCIKLLLSKAKMEKNNNKYKSRRTYYKTVEDTKLTRRYWPYTSLCC